MSWPITDFLNATDGASAAGKDDGDPRVDLYVWFGRDAECTDTEEGCTVGLAWTGGACQDYVKASFNEWQPTPTENAMV